MKKRTTLKKITMAAGVIAMGIGLVQSFNLEAQTTGGGLCCQTRYQSYCTDKLGGGWEYSRWVGGATTCTGHEQ